VKFPELGRGDNYSLAEAFSLVAGKPWRTVFSLFMAESSMNLGEPVERLVAAVGLEPTTYGL
jgi:hypothetical protein